MERTQPQTIFSIQLYFYHYSTAEFETSTLVPMALQQRNFVSPKMNLIKPMTELVLDDAEQRVVPRSHRVMFHKDVSVTD